LQKDIERITEQQPSGPDPGGELGRLDPLQAPAHGAFRRVQAPPHAARTSEASRERLEPTEHETLHSYEARSFCLCAAEADCSSFPSGGSSTPHSTELDVDSELLRALQPLLMDTRARLHGTAEGAAARREAAQGSKSLLTSARLIASISRPTRVHQLRRPLIPLSCRQAPVPTRGRGRRSCHG
jgi:hypothetical protein